MLKPLRTNYTKFLLSCTVTALLSACGGGSGGGPAPTAISNNTNTPTKPVASSVYQVKVDSPASALATNQTTSSEKLLAALIPPAHAIDQTGLSENNFKVAIVDATGIVLEILEAISITRDPSGTYSLVLPGGGAC